MAASSAPFATRAASNEARSGASAAAATRGRSIDPANARTPSSIEPARIILRFILRPRTAAAANRQRFLGPAPAVLRSPQRTNRRKHRARHPGGLARSLAALAHSTVLRQYSLPGPYKAASLASTAKPA